jgi:hypothetical protein
LDTAAAGGRPEVVASGLIDLVKARTFFANNKGKYKQTIKATLETNEQTMAYLIVKMEYNPTPQGLQALKNQAEYEEQVPDDLMKFAMPNTKSTPAMDKGKVNEDE